MLIDRWPDLDRAGAQIMVRGGWGGNLELGDVRARVQRAIGNPASRCLTGRLMTTMPAA